MSNDDTAGNSSTKPGSVWVEPSVAWAYGPRLRFAATTAIYGAAMGAFAVIVNFLSQAQFPFEAQHMTLGRTVIFSLAGALGGLLVTAPFAFWLHGGDLTLFPERTRKPLGFWSWIFLGLGYGLIFPFLMGAYVLPFTFNILDFGGGFISANELVSINIDTVLRGPAFAVVLGTRLLFTALIAGAMFGAGGWVIDRFHSSSDEATARYGTWAMALALAVAVFAVLAIVPESALANLG